VQGFSEAPRQSLTEAQVRQLLSKSSSIRWSFGADLLNFDLTPAGTTDLIGGTIKRNYRANIHGTCDLELDSTFDYARGLIRPWMAVTDGALSAQFYVGVYTLTTPENRYGVAKPVSRRVQGYDRLYLLTREIGTSWVAPKNANVLDEVRRAITAAGLTGVLLDSTASSVTLPEAMIWPLVQAVGDTPAYDLTKRQQQTGLENATTWLRVINDLLFSIGYVGLYADPSTGVYRSGPYVQPIDRPVENVFDFDEAYPIIAPERTRVDDTFKAPNVWVFVRQTMPGNPPAEPVEGAGVYTVDKSAADARGLRYPQQIPMDVTSQAALVSQGKARVASDQRRQTVYPGIRTAAWPLAGHGDTYQFRDVEQGKDVKVQADSWEMNLNGDDMTHAWTEVVA
jgi:hypothetical protein